MFSPILRALSLGWALLRSNKLFASVFGSLAVVVGLLADLGTLSERFTGNEEATSKAIPVPSEALQNPRTSANNCRSSALSLVKSSAAAEEVLPFLLCMEKGYFRAIEGGDAMGAYGLSIAYASSDFRYAWQTRYDSNELRVLATKHWCDARSSGIEMTFVNPPFDFVVEC